MPQKQFALKSMFLFNVRLRRKPRLHCLPPRSFDLTEILCHEYVIDSSIVQKNLFLDVFIMLFCAQPAR